MKTIIAHGKVERGWIGVGVQDLTQELAKSPRRRRSEGRPDRRSGKGGPADRAGLKKKDVSSLFRVRRSQMLRRCEACPP